MVRCALLKGALLKGALLKGALLKGALLKGALLKGARKSIRRVFRKTMKTWCKVGGSGNRSDGRSRNSRHFLLAPTSMPTLFGAIRLSQSRNGFADGSGCSQSRRPSKHFPVPPR